MKGYLTCWLTTVGLFFSSAHAFAYDNSATSYVIAKATKKKSGKKVKAKSEDAEHAENKEEAAKDPTAPDASKKKKKAHKSLGVIASLGYEDADWSEADLKYSLGGFGFTGGVNYSLHLNDKFSIPVSGGLRMTSMAGQNDSGTLTLTLTTIFIELGADFWATPSLAIGGVFGMDMMMSGSFAFKYNDDYKAKDPTAEDSTLKVASFSRMMYGGGVRYFITDAFKIFGDVFLTSGTFKPQSDKEGVEYEATKYSGKIMRLGLGYYFL